MSYHLLVINPFTNPNIRKTASKGRINGSICIPTLIKDCAILAIPVPKVETSAASTVTNASELTVAQSDSKVINPNPIAVNIEAITLIFKK